MKKHAAIVAVATGALLVGCSSHDTQVSPSTSMTSSSSSAPVAQDTAPIGKPGTPRGGKVEVNTVKRTDVLAVATAAVKGSNTVDLTLDNSPVDAQRRVSALMTPGLAKILSRPLASQSEVGGGFPGWDELRARQGYSTVSVMNVSEDGDGVHGNTATQRLFITVTGHDSHGWVKQLSTSTQLVTMTRTASGSPWQVQSMQSLGQ